ncbi:MAG: hypothetical protein ACREJO_00925 [Phycisphaerales bacterium]
MRSTILSFAALSVCALSADAGTISFRINGGATTALTGGTINIPIGTSTPTIIHIFDDTTALANGNNSPAASLGDVQINRASGSGPVYVFIADADESPVNGSGYLLQPAAVHAPGVVNINAISCGTDTVLRDETTLIAWIGDSPTTGDAFGAIDLGQVWALDVPHNIVGDVTAHTGFSSSDVYPPSDPGGEPQATIRRIRCGNQISSTIKAVGGSSASFTASIQSVILGPSTSAVGITGDILAPTGFIQSITSTGPIGTSTLAAKVEAAYGVREIRAINESGSSGLLNQNFFIDLKTGPTEFAMPLDSVSVFEQNSNGHVRLIETAGNLTGDLKIGNLAGKDTPGTHSGIFVQGQIQGSIDIRYTQDYADIIAEAITAPITIGVQCRGAIVAYGTPTTTSDPAGSIASLTIGRADLTSDEYPFTLYSVPTTFRPGFIGNHAAPIDMSRAGLARWFDARLQVAGDATPPTGSIDSLIFADRITSLDIAELSNSSAAAISPTSTAAARASRPAASTRSPWIASDAASSGRGTSNTPRLAPTGPRGTCRARSPTRS